MRPEDETIDWIFAAARWWLESFGGPEQLARRARDLVPTAEDFPIDPALPGPDRAAAYFARVVAQAGLSGWDFVLVEDEAPDVAALLRGMPHHGGEAGLASWAAAPLGEGDPLAVPYDPDQLADPVDLVATFARRVSHYLVLDAPLPFTDVAEEHAYLVDLGAVFLGFGVFLCNGAFSYDAAARGTMVGWGVRRRGALSQCDASYVLALAATLRAAPDAELLPHLGANPRGFFQAARAHLQRDRQGDVAALRAVVPRATGPYR